MNRHKFPAAILLAALMPAASSRAVIFYSTSDITHNTTAPTGSLLNSGWQWEGTWHGSYLGTAIAPQYFITAAHVSGNIGDPFTLNGTPYTTIPFADGNIDELIPGTDLALWRVSGTFSSYAPMWNQSVDGSETGKPLVVIGRGTQRGSPFIVSGTQKGWLWGAADSVERWGQNLVTGTTDFATSGDHQLLYFNFDAPGVTNEAVLSDGDSGGGVFIQSGSTWKLAAINYGVYGTFSLNTPANGDNTLYNAALYDMSGLYLRSSNNLGFSQAVTGPAPSFASRVSPNQTQIQELTNHWNADANGTWSTAGNWINGAPLNGYGASFTNVITAPRTITLTNSVSLAGLGFDSSFPYTIAGAGTITLTNNGQQYMLGVQSGSDTISAPISLASYLTTNIIPSTSTLTVSGTLTSNGYGIYKTGAGTLALNNFRGSDVTVNGGTIRILPNGSSTGTSEVSSLTVAPATSGTIYSTGSFDLNDNDLVINYPGISPATAILGLLHAGINGGAWSIMSTAANNDSLHRTAIGWAEASSLLPPSTTTWSGQPVDTTSLLLKYTWIGDANLDGKIDNDDYALLDRGRSLGLTGWVNGDFNYDGIVDKNDYMLIDRVYSQQNGILSPDLLTQRQAEFGSAYVQELILSVPEPAITGLIVIGALGLRRRRS